MSLFCDQVNENSTLVINAQPEAIGLRQGANSRAVTSCRRVSFHHGQQFRQPPSQVCQLWVDVKCCSASVVLFQVTHVCVGEEVTGGNATDRLVDVHGCDIPRCPENPH